MKGIKPTSYLNNMIIYTDLSQPGGRGEPAAWRGCAGLGSGGPACSRSMLPPGDHTRRSACAQALGLPGLPPQLSGPCVPCAVLGATRLSALLSSCPGQGRPGQSSLGPLSGLSTPGPMLPTGEREGLQAQAGGRSTLWGRGTGSVLFPCLLDLEGGGVTREMSGE